MPKRNENKARYNDEAMLELARLAVASGVSRSSFAQCAEWAHDMASDEAAARKS